MGLSTHVLDTMHGTPASGMAVTLYRCVDSGYTQLARFALDGIVSFSTVPLRVWSYLGLIISALAFTYVLGFLFKSLVFGFDPAAPGFPSLIIAVMFLGGVQMISLGVIGEYLGRMYEEVKARPMFLVTDEIGIPPLASVAARKADMPASGRGA